MDLRAEVHVSEGRTQPLPFQLMQGGVPYDLSLATGVALTLVRTNQWLSESWDYTTADVDSLGLITKVSAAACSIVSATLGKVNWTPGATDLDTPGWYFYQFTVTTAAGNDNVPDDLFSGLLRVHPAARPV